MKNVKGAYQVVKNVDGKRILLVDDIYTTGSTLDECAKVLLEAGAKDVIGFCCAINRDFTVEDGERFKNREKNFLGIW